MSLDSFIGMDSGEPMSEGAFEKLREKMRAAAAQIAAIKKEEKKQKKKEYDLLKVLLKFVKTSHKKDLTLLISRVLEINVPANFILSVIILGNEEIQREAGSALMLESPEEQNRHTDAEKRMALTFFNENDESLPLRIKIELDNWIKNLLSQAQEVPEKLIKTAYKIEIIELEKEYEFEDQKYEEKKYVQPPLVNLAAYIIRDFLEQNKTSEPYEKIHEFAKFILNGILTKTKDSIDNRQLLT